MHDRSAVQYSVALQGNANFLGLTCALAVARLLAIINFSDLNFGGDGMGYLSAAQFILEQARLPELTYQSRGFSIFLAGLIAVSNDWERSFEIFSGFMDISVLIVISFIAIIFIKMRYVLYILLIILFAQPFTIS